MQKLFSIALMLVALPACTKEPVTIVATEVGPPTGDAPVTTLSKPPSEDQSTQANQSAADPRASLPGQSVANKAANDQPSAEQTNAGQPGTAREPATSAPLASSEGGSQPNSDKPDELAEKVEIPPLSESENEARLNDLLSLVKDNTLGIHKRENPAYFGLLKKALDRTLEQLIQEVDANPRFNDLYTHPDKYRGNLVHVNLNARRIISIPVKVRNEANLTKVYEIWGWTEEAKAHMYCCVVPEIPEGFEEGDVSKRIDLAGYFLKMQAYQPGNAEPNQRNLVAPLIMGRITDAGPVAKKANDPMGHWPVILIIGFGTIVMLRLMMHLRGMTRTTPTHRHYRRRSLAPLDPDALAESLGESDRGLQIRNARD